MDKPFHPTDSDLILFHDDELPPSTAGGIKTHLEYCPDCRTRLGQLHAVVSAYHEFHQQALGSSAASLPRPWPSLQPRLRSLGKPVKISNRRLILRWAAAALVFMHLPFFGLRDL